MIVRPPWSPGLTLWHVRHKLAFRLWSARCLDILNGHRLAPLPHRRWWEQRQGPL